jgi:nucleotide-binding universal stress UspA family protein
MASRSVIRYSCHNNDNNKELIVKILVAVDGSDHSIHAAEWAGKLAGALDAELTLFHIFEATPEETMALAHMSQDEIAEKMQNHARSSFDSAMEKIASDVNVNTAVTLGHPADEILDKIKYDQYDHVVMGSRGLSVLEEVFMGSVSEKVIRRAPCPVTIMR